LLVPFLLRPITEVLLTILYSQLTQNTVKSILVTFPFNKSACSIRNNNHKDQTQRSEGIWDGLVKTACVLQ